MAREQLRSGGRSARIQQAVHEAVRKLGGLATRNAITVPQVAAAAGVPPSTIYRRWGDLQSLLADVAVERLRPVGEPDDTGSAESDLRAFMEQYAEEMASPVGRALISDVLSSPSLDQSSTCCSFTTQHLTTIIDRARARGEPSFDLDEVVDHVVAPVFYRIVAGGPAPTAAYCNALVDRIYQRS